NIISVYYLKYMFIYCLILEQIKRGYLMEELLKKLVEKIGNLQQMVM
ncbi:hypothetical protein HMPREF9094_2544, partial [Fusobacterium animalis ATCC 51191]